MSGDSFQQETVDGTCVTLTAASYSRMVLMQVSSVSQFYVFSLFAESVTEESKFVPTNSVCSNVSILINCLRTVS